MNPLRIAQAAVRVRSAKTLLSIQRRGYAEAVSDKIKLTLALPHQVGHMHAHSYLPLRRVVIRSLLTRGYVISPYISRQMCTVFLPAMPFSEPQLGLICVFRVQVNIPAETGEMGVLANHVPSIEQLRPGLVEIIEEAGGSKQFFCRYT